VLIGHSDGAFLFERLLQEEFRSFRKVFAGAILLGGNVLVDAHDRARALRQPSHTGSTDAVPITPIFAGINPQGIVRQTGVAARDPDPPRWRPAADRAGDLVPLVGSWSRSWRSTA
jgi:hypothetical protein